MAAAFIRYVAYPLRSDRYYLHALFADFRCELVDDYASCPMLPILIGWFSHACLVWNEGGWDDLTAIQVRNELFNAFLLDRAIGVFK